MPRPEGRRRQESPSPRRSPRAKSVGRALTRHRPWPAGRHESTSRCGSFQSHKRRASPHRAPPVRTPRRLAPRLRRWRAPASGASACHPPTGCNASLQRAPPVLWAAWGARFRARSRPLFGAPRDTTRTSRSVFVVREIQRRRRGPELAAFIHDLDPPLGLFETRVAEARQLHAALVELERFLECEVAFLQLLDDGFELGDGGLEILDGWISHGYVV